LSAGGKTGGLSKTGGAGGKTGGLTGGVGGKTGGLTGGAGGKTGGLSKTGGAAGEKPTGTDTTKTGTAGATDKEALLAAAKK